MITNFLKDYSPFERFVFRTPLFSINRIDDVSPEKTAIFREAIYIASPDFYAEWMGAPADDRKCNESILKYYSRSFSRSTPFGLFAGCSTGRLSEANDIRLDSVSNFQRRTRLDMQYLCALIQNMEKIPEIRQHLLFYPNDSIYKLGGDLRYIEYTYKGTHRLHNISSVDSSEYLDLILSNAENGATIDQLAALLVDDEISHEDATDFLNEVIDSQVLKSELDPSVVGGDILEVLIEKLSRTGDSDILQNLKSVTELYHYVARDALGAVGFRIKIIAIIETLGVPFEKKYLFQTDLYKPVINGELSMDVIKSLKKAMNMMLAFAQGTPSNPTMDNFKKAFYERYEDEELPLLEVLDRDTGIGYPSQQGAQTSPEMLIDDLPIGGQKQAGNVSLGPIDQLLLKKYTESLKTGERVITLSDSDIPENKSTGIALSDTIPVMCTIVGKNDMKIFINSAGGSSAANLLGRFCHIDDSIMELVGDVANREKELKQDFIVAEISHLPDSRLGNIASRPHFREYVLHYLSNFERDAKDISASDLTISCKHGQQLTLRSKKYGKRIIPRLTCAHNYSMSSIPLYRFLCDYQFEGIAGGMGFAFGQVFNMFDHLPRVEYGDIILIPESWVIKEDEVKHLNPKQDNATLEKEMKTLIESRNINPVVIIPDGDNKLLINFNKAEYIRLFLSLIKKRKSVKIEEYLFAAGGQLSHNEQLISDEQGAPYANEFLILLHK